MGFGRGGAPEKGNAKNQQSKKLKAAMDATFKRQPRNDNRRGGTGPKLSEHIDEGHLKLTEEMTRTFIAVSHMSRFDEPAVKEWPDSISILHEEVPAKKSTIKSIFEKLANDCNEVSDAIKRGSGGGHK